MSKIVAVDDELEVARSLLPIVYDVVESHGGTIEIDSTPKHKSPVVVALSVQAGLTKLGSSESAPAA